jgi:hypothetical protein
VSLHGRNGRRRFGSGHPARSRPDVEPRFDDAIGDRTSAGEKRGGIRMNDMRALGNHAVMQNAFVVNDIDEAIQRWTTVFGAGPFFTTTHDVLSNPTYRGKPQTWDAKIAVGQAGDLQIEFIEVLEKGPNVYHEVIPKGTEGFHHICISPPDFDATVAHYNDRGYETVCTAEFGDDMRVAFVNTYRDFGFMLEIVSENAFLRDAYRRIKEASVGWDGVTRPSRPIDELFAG